MRNFPALRLGAICFFCLGVLGFFGRFSQDKRFYSLLALLVPIAALVAVRIGKKPLRLVILLTPAFAFFIPVTDRINMLVGGAVILFSAITLTFGDIGGADLSYRKKAGVLLAACGIGVTVSFFTDGGNYPFRLLICAAGLTLLALRMQQAAGSLGAAWQAGSAGMLATVLFTGAAVGLIVWALRSVLLDLFTLLSSGFAFIISAPILLVSWLWGLGLTGAKPDESTGQDAFSYISVDPNEKPVPDVKDEVPDVNVPVPDVEVPWTALLAVAVFVVLIIAAIMFIRSGKLHRLRGRKVRKADGAKFAEPKAKRKKSRGIAMDNRGQLRAIYGNYMEFLREQGARYYAGMTTEEISGESAKLLVQSDELLRELYRRARYSDRPVSDGDLAAAKAAYDRLTAVNNRRDGGGAPAEAKQ